MALAIGLFGGSANAEKIIIRSGTVGTTPLTPGSFWTQAHGLVSSKANAPAYWTTFSFPFNAGFSFACASSSSPKVVTPAPGWILGLPWNPPARWVSYDIITPEDKPPARSSLLCIPFTITTAATFKATLKFTWAVDNRLGDPAGGPNPDGVYVNHHGCNITGGSFTTASSAERDITAFVQTGGNVLHIYQRDTTVGSYSGIIFSAVITVCPVGATTLDVTVRSGTINGVTANADQSVDQKCDRGKQNKPLDLDFSNCTKSTYVDGVNTWNGNPPGADPSARWLYWKNGFGNRKPLSALVRAPFYIPWVVSTATMTFSGAADDRLGDPNGDGSNPNGVYVNGVGVSPAIRSTSFTTLTTGTATVAVSKGWNNLYVYARDVLDIAAGTIFSATFHLEGGQPCSGGPNDPYDPGGPIGIAAFPSGPNQISVLFDRDLTIDSVQNPAHYSFTGGAIVTDAMLGIDGRSALLTVSDESPFGTVEGLTVSGITAADTTVSMPAPQTLPLVSGVQGVRSIQLPDPAALSAECVDRSRFCAADGLPGAPVTIYGTCIGRALECFSLEDSTMIARSGVLISGSSVDMIPGRRYQVSGRVQESEGETVLMDIMDVRELDGGVALDPVSRPISTFRRASCDATQSVETGEDYEGMFVRVASTTVVRGLQDESILVKDTYGSPADTIAVCGLDSTFTNLPAVGTRIDIVGLLVFRDGQFQIAPRNRGDITLPQGGPVRSRPNIHLYPNPANPSVTIAFTLTRSAQVKIDIYDLRGALVRQLANGSFAKGDNHVTWDGLGGGGNRVASGMYFYRVRTADWTEEGKLMILK